MITRMMLTVVSLPCSPKTIATIMAMTLPPTHLLNLDVGQVCALRMPDLVCQTHAKMKNAAISDGLQWIGTDLPTTLPEKGHYVSLHIWPDSNFHWLRMNADMKWSHKPGGSPVRDYDNNHDQITDPHQADVSPWSEHCGYMLATPSVSTIHYAASEAVVA